MPCVESSLRSPLLLALAAASVAFHVWLIVSGLIPNLISRPVHLLLALPFVFGFNATGARWSRLISHGVGALGARWPASPSSSRAACCSTGTAASGDGGNSRWRWS